MFTGDCTKSEAFMSDWKKYRRANRDTTHMVEPYGGTIWWNHMVEPYGGTICQSYIVPHIHTRGKYH